MSDAAIASPPPEVAVLVGLQGAGKSSFVAHRFATTHVHVGKDLMGSARDKDARQARMIADALAQGRSVVVDNTNVTRAARAPLVAQAHALGARAAAYFLDVPPRECAQRNHLRAGRARVPPVAIWAAARRLEVPAADEGFDDLFRVTPLPGHGFHVEPLAAAPK